MDVLQRLCASLQLETPSRPLRAESFAQWKPLVERKVFNNEGDQARTLAHWMIDLAGEAIAEEREDALALAAWTLAGVCMFLDEPQPALERYLQAEAIYRAHNNTRMIAHLSVGLVSTLDQLGRYDEAIAHGQQVLIVLQDSRDEADQRRLASLYNNIGIACEHVGRYLEAVEYYERKAHWWQTRVDGSQAVKAAIEAARAQVNLGSAQKFLGLYVEAHRSFSAARHKFAQFVDEGSAKIDLARADMHLAWLEITRDNRQPVIAAALAQARLSRAAVDPAGTSNDLALLELVEAGWLMRSAQLDRVDPERVAQVQQRLAQAGLPRESDRASLLLAELALQQREFAEASVRYAAIGRNAQQRGDVDMAHLAGVGSAKALRAMGDVPAAMHTLNSTLAHTERIRHRLTDDTARAGYLQDKLPAYQALVALHLEQRDFASALQTVERARARTLADLLAHASHENDGDAAEAKAELNLVDLFATLPTDALIVSYALIHGQVWVFLADQHGFVCDPIQLGPTLTYRALQDGLERITAVSRLPMTPVTGATATAHANADAGEIAQQIRTAQGPLGAWHATYIAPLQPWLNRYARLFVAPDGLLNLLPFRCLFNRQTGRYLVELHDVIMLPSLSVWHSLAQMRGRDTVVNASHSMLAVGFSSNGRLAGAEAEARQIGAHFAGASLLLEGAATRTAFAQSAEAAQLIYIASHAAYRSDAAQFSFIELADGRLEAQDIIKLRLRASSVVLSACETGMGRMTGNEVLGLARAFLHAGARSVVATHWKVDDDATARLMAEFAHVLSQGESLAQSLTLAQCAFIQKSAEGHDKRSIHAHPFYWGAPAFIGLDGFCA